MTNGAFDLSAGALCLDFANTLGDRPRGREEGLAGYEDLLRWAEQTGELTTGERSQLERNARQEPKRTAAVFRTALELRETVYRIFTRAAISRAPAPKDLQQLNSALHRALSHLEIRNADGGFCWSWIDPADALERPLWPVARSAAELLTSERLSSVRECAAKECSWLFLDSSRNRRRRWCDMATCGNRAKARRYHARRKKARGRR